MSLVNRYSRLILAAIIFVSPVFVVMNSQGAHAADLDSRKLTLVAGDGGDGGSKVSGDVKHDYTFTIPSNTNIGSIRFLYCMEASGAGCTAPTGLLTTAAAIETQTGVAGFTIVSAADNEFYLTRAASVGTGAVHYLIEGITNPNSEVTFYARVSTYTDAALGGSVTDSGVFAASTAEQIVLTGQMPESLIFCVGATIGAPGGIPDCSTASSGAISFNQLFSPSDTAYATSQMAASTNASEGYNITVNGLTLMNGGVPITAMSAAGISVRSTGQFGMNLVDNTTNTVTPDVGTAIAPVSNQTNYRGQALAGYNTDQTFKFASGDSVANSADAVAGPSDSQIFTVSYIVNVPGSQAAGTYVTTLTYICTATY